MSPRFLIRHSVVPVLFDSNHLMRSQNNCNSDFLAYVESECSSMQSILLHTFSNQVDTTSFNSSNCLCIYSVVSDKVVSILAILQSWLHACSHIGIN